MYVLGICDSSAILNVFWIIKLIIMIISVCVPIILMVMLMIDFMKAIQIGDQDLLKKARDIAVKRSIACVLIFLVPTFVNVLTKVTSGNSDYHACYDGATLDYISQRRSEEEEAQRLSLEALKTLNQKKAEEYAASHPENNGTSTALGNRIVQIASEQIGNKGGKKFWSWYGHSSHVQWCVIFVSWLGNEAGVLGKNIPKKEGTGNMKRWFIAQDKYKYKNSYTPKPGDVVFFDENHNGSIEHVGIVEYVGENGKIHTIEGNYTDQVKRVSRDLDEIEGYGVV